MAYLRLNFKVSEHSRNDYRTTFKLFYAKTGLRKPHIKSSENYQQQPEIPETSCDKSTCLPQTIHCSNVTFQASNIQTGDNQPRDVIKC